MKKIFNSLSQQRNAHYLGHGEIPGCLYKDKMTKRHGHRETQPLTLCVRIQSGTVTLQDNLAVSI